MSILWRVVVSLQLLVTVAACGSSEHCTDDARYSSVAVTRDLTIPFAEASKLSFEACAGSSCETVRPPFAGDVLSSFRLLSGGLSQRADGTTRVEARILLNEPGPGDGPVTPVSIRATDSSGARVLDVSGQVRWQRSDHCHVAAVDTQL